MDLMKCLALPSRHILLDRFWFSLAVARGVVSALLGRPMNLQSVVILGGEQYESLMSTNSTKAVTGRLSLSRIC
jgi:hypothetical protein